MKRLFVLLFAVLLTSCATITPGSDPVVVRTEQTLTAADAIYAESMRYYFAPGVAPNLGPDTVKIFEAVRTGFDPAYKEVQKALDSYKRIRGTLEKTALATKQTELARVLNPAAAATPSKPKPIEVP